MAADRVEMGGRWIGDGQPVFIVAEIGINHNGEMALVRRLVDAAAHAGCDAVKFQKRTPEECVPEDQWDRLRETPWGVIPYIEYRHKVELGQNEFEEIDEYCRDREILWFTSCWDRPSVDFVEMFNPIGYKIASASVTDGDLLHHVRETGRPVVLSTGMSTMDEIRSAVAGFDPDRLVLTHSTSAYPCAPEELNLRAIETLRAEFDLPVGYSGHEVGLQTTYAAVALGACYVERHITLDRTMWGTDQAASVEPHGFARLVRDIRVIERALGDGVKRIYDSELESLAKLRRRT